MNEEQKNIETCLAENILSDVANVPTDPQFRSLTDEALDPLKQQALRQAGYDGYKKVVWTHQPYTFTSQVKQMKSNLILLLRRLWRYPFGRGTTASSAAGSSAVSSAGSSASDATPISSLADMWQHYITRLKGNPEYGIPSRLSQLTDLPSAPALLADRDMSSGIRFGTNPLPDGISLAQLLFSTPAATQVTEIVDDNVGWTMDKAISGFPNLEKVILKCKRWEESANRLNPMMINLIKVKEVIADELEYIPDDAIPNRTNASLLNGLTACESVSFKSLKRARMVYPTGGVGARLFNNMPSLKVVYFDGMEYINVYRTDNFDVKFASDDSLENIYLGNLNKNKQEINLDNQTHLVLISINGCEGSFNLSTWNPTNVLSERLPDFLSNFKTYIAERLTDQGTGLTLTLSQEVRNAIHAAESTYGIENIIITKKGWTISPAPN